jgi:hypothetical protein
MKTSNISLSLSQLLLLSGAVLLAGCGGAVTGLPDSVITPTGQSSPIAGSVFGGHAPIIGAHVYILQAGTGGYASAPTNIMTSGAAGSDSHGNYVTTASDGSFSITGDYACTPGSGGKPGLPVYLAAIGGAPYVPLPGTTTPTPVNITYASSSLTNKVNSYYVLTFTGYNLLYAGQSVTLSGLTGTGWTTFNGTTQTIYSATDTSFTILYLGGAPTPIAQSGAKATVVPNPPVPNPAIANLAVLGNCPTTGNFSTTGTGSDVISYVFMNEVSSAAAAYAFSGFGSGPFNIGTASSAMAQTALQNAANNAAQLYSIQGYYNSTVYAGEGHIANPVTPSGGTVAQTTLDTLGNIIASCVDSANTANSSLNPGASGASAACDTLFTYATSNGIPYGYSGTGTIATDTATALFNIAHNPAGNANTNSNYVTRLFALQGAETTPFAPNLTAPPTDYTVAISFPVAGSPQSVETDANGNFWYTSLIAAAPTYPCTNSNCGTSTIVEDSPLGATLYTHTNTSWDYGDVTIDSSGNAWTGNQSGYDVSTEVLPGTPYVLDTTGQDFTYGAGPVANGAGDVYIVHGPTAGYPQNGDNVELTEFNASRNAIGSQPFIATSFSTGAGFTAPYYNVRHGAIDQVNTVANFSNLWLVSEGGGIISKILVPSTTGLPEVGFPIGNPQYPAQPCNMTLVNPEQPAIDANGNAWVPINNVGNGTSVLKITPTGNCASYQVDSGPYGAAVDGANTVWITNQTGNTITQLNATSGAASINYKADNFLSSPAGIAIDISGDLLITNSGTGGIVEVIGAATPTYAPLGVAAANSKLGAQP